MDCTDTPKFYMGDNFQLEINGTGVSALECCKHGYGLQMLCRFVH